MLLTDPFEGQKIGLVHGTTVMCATLKTAFNEDVTTRAGRLERVVILALF